MFLPSDPARTGRIAFWRPDGEAPRAIADGSTAELDIVMPTADGGVQPVREPALLLTVHRAGRGAGTRVCGTRSGLGGG